MPKLNLPPEGLLDEDSAWTAPLDRQVRSQRPLS